MTVYIVLESTYDGDEVIAVFTSVARAAAYEARCMGGRTWKDAPPSYWTAEMEVIGDGDPDPGEVKP